MVIANIENNSILLNLIAFLTDLGKFIVLC